MFSSLGLTSVETGGNILISNTLFDFKDADPSLFDNTELIIHPNSGYDNFPVSFVKEATFPIVVGNPIRAEGVAEYSLSCLFQNYSSVPRQKAWHPGRHWDRPLLSELKVLIVGFGHIGKLIYHSLNVLGVRPDVYDPDQKKDQCDGLYDCVIMACSLNPTSHHLVNADFLEQHMKTDGCLINGARGKLVKQEDLKEFALAHQKFTAFLDVFEKEPQGLEYFSSIPNITTSSHIAGVSHALDDLMISFERKILEYWLSGKNLEEVCPELLLGNRIRHLESSDFLI